MSVVAYRMASDRSHARSGDRLLLFAIAWFARDDGTNAYPSNARLQRMTRLGERAVRKNLQNLVRAGELRIRRNAGPHGCNCYDITLPGPQTEARPDASSAASDGSEPCCE
jgi:hypothetical protein